MARALRIAYPGAFYHVTCRGNEQRVIFRDDQDRETFLGRLQVSLRDYQVHMHVYVLMDNHFHLVVETPQANLSEFMRHFNVSYTGYFNRRHKRVGHLYQGRFKAIVVEADAYLLEVSRYVHLNPIRAGRLRGRSAEEKLRYVRGYRWSSLGGYLRREDREGFVHYERVLGYVGGDTARGRRVYTAFIEDGAGAGVERPWVKVRGQVLLGMDPFVDEIRGRLGRAGRRSREQPAVRGLSKRWEPEALLHFVARALGADRKALCARGGGWERAILMECLHRYARLSQVKIGRRMGGVDYTWVSRMRADLQRQMQRDAGLRKVFESVESRILTHK